MIKVELVDSMGTDATVSNVARVSFDKWKEEFDAQDAKLIKFLAEHKHITPFRHPHVMVRCSAPIWLARQLGKHQIGMSWNEVSRRYVDTGVELYSPDALRLRPEGGIKQGSSAETADPAVLTIAEDMQRYAKVIYEYLIDQGVAPEQARGYLPQNMMTSWIWTGSLAAFAHVYNLRADSHAQLEAQWFAEMLDETIRPLFPNAWSELTHG